VTLYYGVDPGLSGAIATLDGDIVRITPIPIVKSGKSRNQYDLVAINELFCGQIIAPGFAMIEKQQPMPLAQGGTIANYNRGCARIFEMACVAARIPYELVPPRTWQKLMLAGTSGDDTKQRSIIAAKRLFPGVMLRRSTLCTKDDDGFSDALLLAEYGRRRQQGTQT